MPILSLNSFVEDHEKRHRVLAVYAASKRGRDWSDPASFERLTRRSAMSLFATNDFSRIAFARAADVTFAKLQRLLQGRTPSDAYMLSIAPKHMALPISVAHMFNHQEAIQWLHGVLGAKNYFGAIDLAYYSNFSMPGSVDSPTVSWHFHILVWGISKAAIEQIADHLNSNFQPFIPGRQMAHVRHLTAGRVRGRAFYVLKAPLREYRVSPDRDKVDWETGEILREGRGAFWQFKRDLRPGDALRMCQVLGERTIPELLLSSGEGDRIHEQIVRGARRDLRISERHYTWHLQAVTGLPARAHPSLT